MQLSTVRRILFVALLAMVGFAGTGSTQTAMSGADSYGLPGSGRSPGGVRPTPVEIRSGGRPDSFVVPDDSALSGEPAASITHLLNAHQELRRRHAKTLEVLKSSLILDEMRRQRETERARRTAGEDYSEREAEDDRPADWVTDQARRDATAAVEQRMREMVAPELPQPFGAAFFQRAGMMPAGVPPTPDPNRYRLGPGDQIRVVIWSEMGDETVYDVTITSEGQVFLPMLGLIGAHGQTLAGFERTILDQLTARSKHFRAQVSLTRARTIQVFVVGEVQRPGAHALSGTSTALDALYLAGGPSDKGSMRRIQLMRGSQVIARMDLYAYFSSGDRSNDPLLESGDSIFVPPVGPRVTMQGAILRPGIYEMGTGSCRLRDAIDLAGGLDPRSSHLRFLVQRWNPFGRQIYHDVPVVALDSFTLVDGDVVTVEPALTAAGNRVQIDGAVWRPGEYALDSGRETRLSEVIRRAGGVIAETVASSGQIIRVTGGARERLLTFDPTAAVEGRAADDLILAPNDRIHVFATRDTIADRRRIYIRGAVRRPGEYIVRDGMRLRDLVLRARGVSLDAADEAEIARRTATGGVTITRVAVRQALADPGHPANIELQSLDQVNVLVRGDVKLVPDNVAVSGEVARPGTFAIDKPGMRLSDVIKRAGGVNPAAFIEGAVLLRRGDQLMAEPQLKVIEKVQRDLYQMADLDLRADLLRSGAKLTDVGGREVTRTVDAGGQDLSAAGERRSEAGTGPGGSKSATVPTPGVVSSGKAEEDALEVSGTTGVGLSSPRLWGRQGRVPIDLAVALAKPGSPADIELRDGDELLVPMRPSTVGVIGAVVNPSNIVFTPGRPARHYLERVGGFAANANHRRTLVVRANGEVVPLARVRQISLGDVIVVPPRVNLVRPTKLQKLQEIGEVAKILGNLALVYQVMENAK